MLDQARKITDKKLNKMIRKIDRIYRTSYNEVSAKWNKYMESHEPKLQNAYNDLHNAILKGDRDEIYAARQAYERIAMNITVNNERFQAMANETASKLSHINEVALNYVNDQIPGIYTINYNAFGKERIKGYSFSLVNEQAIKNLAITNKMLLPLKKIDIPKDIAWNKKLINSQMMQGILQGESIPEIAKRLQNVSNMDKASAVRNARTMTTSAENKGRQDSYKKAQSDGIDMVRVWVATHDERTRAWHADLDGVEVNVDEPWDNDYGQIMYPGDPSADPCNVYNCRCAMKVKIKGFKKNG